jgi:hypothetical protein
MGEIAIFHLFPHLPLPHHAKFANAADAGLFPKSSITLLSFFAKVGKR